MTGKYSDAIKAKAIVLPHSFDYSLYDKEIDAENSGKIRMVYIGHLDDIRTPHLFLKAIASMKKEHSDLAEKLEVFFYGNMSVKEKVYLLDNELLDIVQIKKPVDYKTSLSLMKNSDWLIHIDANLSGVLDENIFFAAKLADYIGADRPIFGITMFDGAGADVVRDVNGLTVSYTVDEIKNYLYLILYEGYQIEVNEENRKQIEAMTDELCKEYIAKDNSLANKNDMTALFRIGYGLYVVTTNDGRKENGLIVNTVTQLTDNPYRVAVNINKANYSHHVIQQTGVLNVNCLSVDAPFSVFQQFGFQSGRTVDKFAGEKINRSGNGLIFLDKYINAFMSLKVEQYVDLGTHGMFICSVTEARVINDRDTMSYTYYQQNVKPQPETAGKKGFVCKVCGYIYEGDELPADIICPLCKHGAVDFEPIQ